MAQLNESLQEKRATEVTHFSWQGLVDDYQTLIEITDEEDNEAIDNRILFI